MNFKTLLSLTIIILLFSIESTAQKYTLSGTIKDKKTGESVIGASVHVLELPTQGAISNEYGFYSLTLPQGTYKVVVQYISYQADTQTIDLSKDVKLSVSLSTADNILKEAIVSAKRDNENITKSETGVERLDMAEINKLPVLFGERDILKSMQLLPGIKSSGEGGTGFNVRGGNIDQNLILLDEAPVYNASHLLGFFSTFNSDAIKDVLIYKGTQPAQYGGRLSSAVDIRMKEGNKQGYEVDGSIGLISAKLDVEGPIIKDKGSFFIAARGTYLGLLLKASPKYKDNKIDFYDINLKANYRLGEKDVLYLSGYFGGDELGINKTFGLNWGNGVGTLRWNHLLNSKVFANTSLIYSNYHYHISLDASGSTFNVISNIQDFNLKHEYQYFPSSQHSFRFGVNSIFHNITPGQVTAVTGGTTTQQNLQNRHSWENALYASDDWKTTEWLSLNMGVRLSSFSVLGKGDFYNLNANNDTTGSTHYGVGQFVTTYFNVEPRLTANFIISKSNSIKVAYARNTQNLHLISNSTAGSPTDKWIPDNNNIKPEIADQVSLGYFQNVWNNTFELSVEGYFKWMQHQLDYRDGASVLNNDAIETQLYSGVGKAYGVEFLVKKKLGKVTGWIGYTLSRTEKKIDKINNGDWYKAAQDKPHDLSIVVSYDVKPRVNLSATWVYNTGRAVTYPSGKYYVDGQVYNQYTTRNADRFPDYHRLDVAVNIKLKDHPHYTSELSLSLYNAYGRENAYSISITTDKTDPNKTDVVQTSLFRWVPSISWNFKIK